MPVTRSKKGSVADLTEERPSPTNQEPGNTESATSAPRSTGMMTRSTTSSARVPPASARQEKSATTSEGTATTKTTATEYTTSTEKTASTETNVTTQQAEDSNTVKPSKRAKSHRSEAHRRKLLELEAQEKLAELKLEEIRASLALAQLKLQKQRAAAADDDEAASASEDEEEEERSSRVQEWLDHTKNDPPEEEKRPEEGEQKGRGQGVHKEKECEHRGDHEETRPARQPQNVDVTSLEGPEEGEQKGRGQGVHKEKECEHRGEHEETRPARQPQNVDVTSLAAALTQAVRMTRDAPKYLQELPVFNGQCNSWLAFRAAYYETEALFSKTENVARIRRGVRGAAWEAISSLLISQPDPAAIMEALERRFGRPDALAMNEMQKIKALGKLSDSPRDLCIFANKVANIVSTMEALKKIHYLYNPELVKTTIEKLTPIMRSKWYDYAAKNKEDVPDLKRLTNFLNEEADKCGAYAQPEDIVTNTTQEKHPRRRFEHTFATDTKNEQCPACKQSHHLPECKRFQDIDVNERWEMAKRHRICFRCLRSTHRRGTCRAKKCGQDGCAMDHHHLLHHKRSRRTSSPSPPAIQEVTSAVELVKNIDCIRSRQAYLKIAPVTLIGQNEARVDTYALMDDGSTITLVDEGLAEILGLDGPRDQMWVQGLNETVKHENSKRVDIKIRGRYSEEEYTMRNARTVQRLMFTKQNIERRDLQDCTHLRDIEEQLIYKNASPKILIGQDNWELLVALDIRTGRQDQPVATHTRLGWVLHGYRTSYQKPVAFCGHTTIAAKEDSMEHMMKRFFDLEALGIEHKKQKNDPEERAMKILQEKSRRMPDGRFETALLWKEDECQIPNNYEDAYKRLRTLEKRLDRDPDLKTKYEERINNLLTSGYAAPATTPAPQGKTWYLPHFAVCNPSKPKIRLVHDAAARSHGKSLNDMLLSGPDLLQSLPGVIMRFRQHPFAVSADIQEMFMQIKIRPEDRDALRFLWRGDCRGETKPKEFQMTSVIFGATSSPCTALYIKNRNAEDFAEAFPRAVKEIKKNHYMDDYITSFPSEEEAIEVSKKVDHIHRQAGFVLRGWVSNRQTVLRHFDTNSKTAAVPIGGTDVEKTLGLLWEVKEDCIGFHLNDKKTPPEVLYNNRPPTKREALSVIMSLFDPLGLVSPLTTPAKRLMQETWRYGTGWDEPIPEELQPRWTTWLNNLRAIKGLHIQRCYDMQQSVASRELHTFVDASEEAYATAVYIRTQHVDGSVNVVLVAAKSRVAPLKPTSIPRLELQAALIGARLAKTVAEEHDLEFERKTYWSDSRTVLAWIRAEPRAYKTFVAHRLAEIEDLTKVNEWRWVPTKENVADDATRETPSDFTAQHRWFQGPEFLRRQEEDWPTEVKVTNTETGEERCHASQDIKTHEHLPNIDNIAKWPVLIRATGRVLQFIDLCRIKKHRAAATRHKKTKKNAEKDAAWSRSKKKTDKNKGTTSTKKTEKRKLVCLDASYLLRAEKMWMRKVQDDSYADEKKRIMHGDKPSSKDRLATLSVYMGEDGLLRLRGRIAATPGIQEETANPALLDGQHKYTRMYIQHIHEKMLHGGVETTVNEIRQRFWVTRIRPTVKSVIRRCPQCQMRKAKPAIPSTGNLPPARLTHHARPFSYTGLDYFGPLEVTVGRHREKRWVALFTCLTTRAVHLEVVTSLSADSAIAALRRFIARRGQPTELWSDNATCFKAADKELREAQQEAWEATREEANARRINWRYIPPASPFMGGAWERLVRSVKEALRVILHEKHPSDEVLHTLLVEVENIVNSRPLTHVAVTPEEPEALTPNHILLGPNSHVPAPGSFTQEDQSARQLWKRAQLLADEFWKRWVKEYLPLLQHRREPRATGTAPKIGDLVIICDPNLPRNIWPRGRVTRTYPGEDNEIRVVDVTTSNGHVLRRPCKKIVVLPVESRAATAGEMCTTAS